MVEASEYQATGVIGLNCRYEQEILQLHGSVKHELKTLTFRREAVMNMAHSQPAAQLPLYHLKS